MMSKAERETIALLKEIIATLKRIAPPERGELTWRGKKISSLDDDELRRAEAYLQRNTAYAVIMPEAAFAVSAEMWRRNIWMGPFDG